MSMGRTSILSGQNGIGFSNTGAVCAQCWTYLRQWKLGSTAWIIVLCVIWSTGQLTAHELPCWTPVGHNLTYNFAPKFHAIRQVESGTRNLRIAIHYTHALKSVANFPAITEKLLLPAIKFWTDALAAKNPQVSKLLFSRHCVLDRHLRIRSPDGILRDYCLYGCQRYTYCYTARLSDEYLDYCYQINGYRPSRNGSAGAGLVADYLLIADYSKEHCDGNVLAYAVPCQLEAELDRPILGYTNLCPNSIQLQFPNVEILRSTMIHEIAHALGFSPHLYAFMRDEHGRPRTIRDAATGFPALGMNPKHYFIPNEDTLKTVTRKWMSSKGVFKRNVEVLRTPALLAAAREHYNCSTLDGVDLENQGAGVTMAAHFEKRVAKDELMIGSIGKKPLLVSKLTLSFFVDTGWYNVNMSVAQPWKWGKGMGCDFVLKSCFEYMQLKTAAKQPIGPWCDLPYDGKTECIPYDNAYGRCELKRLSESLPDEFQHFRKIDGIPAKELPYFGGDDLLCDYCPTVDVPTFNDITHALSTHCTFRENQQRLSFESKAQMERFGPSSICINHDAMVPWRYSRCGRRGTLHGRRATCQRHECSNVSGLLVYFGVKPFQCPLAGGSIQIKVTSPSSSLLGAFVCPPCSQICTNCPTHQLPIPIDTAIVPDAYPCSTNRPFSLCYLLFLCIFAQHYFYKVI